MAESEIKYFVRVDDRYIEADLKKVKTKIAASGKSVNSELEKQGKQSAETIGKAAGQAEDKIAKINTVSLKVVNQNVNDTKKALEDVSKKAEGTKETLKEAFGKGLKKEIDETSSQLSGGLTDKVGSVTKELGNLTGKVGLSANAMSGIGQVAVQAVVKGVGLASDMSGAMNDFAIQTGTSKDGLDKYQGVLENIYKNGYGENFNEIADAMGQVKQQFGDLSETDLQSLSESAFILKDNFGVGFAESTAAAKGMMQEFGVSGDEAMNLIAAGMQSGLDVSGDFVSNIEQYAGKFADAGLNAEDMLAIVQAGADSGSYTFDQIGNAVSAMTEGIASGSEESKAGLEAIGLNAEEMQTKFAAGGDSARDAFQKTVDALAQMEDPLAQSQAGANLFGEAWNELGPDAIAQLSGIKDGVFETNDAMEQAKELEFDDMGSMFETLSRSLDMLLLPLGEALMPLLTTLMEALQPILDLFIDIATPILNLIGDALEPLMEILKPIIDLIGNQLSFSLENSANYVTGIFGECVKFLKDQIEGVKENFNFFIDFIKNVFTGNWSGAWDNIKKIFSNIWDMIKNAFKLPFNAIIGGINGFIQGINKIQIPDWVPMVGGKGIHLPEIPRLKIGMDYVPNDYFLAFLDRGERVLTAEENLRFTTAGGMASLTAQQPAGITEWAFSPYLMTEAVRQGLESADILVQGNICTTVEADGRTLGEVTTPYVSGNMYAIGSGKARCSK